MSIGADTAAGRIFDGFSIAADSERDFRFMFTLEIGESIQAYAGTNAVLDVTLQGEVLQ